MNPHDKIDKIYEIRDSLSELYDFWTDILMAVDKRLKELEDETQEEALAQGICLHLNLLDATTIVDLNDGLKHYVCRDCRKDFYFPIEDEDD